MQNYVDTGAVNPFIKLILDTYLGIIIVSHLGILILAMHNKTLMSYNGFVHPEAQTTLTIFQGKTMYLLIMSQIFSTFVYCSTAKRVCIFKTGT